MRRTLRPLITIGLGCILALLSAALTRSASTPSALDNAFGGAAFLMMQPTSTPAPKDLSEIGSTDGIVMMGVLIALIIIIPILLRRKAWLETR